MRSIEERLLVAEAELRKRGVKNTSKLLAESNVLTETAPSNVKKNNGVVDRMLVESAGNAKQRLYETCVKAGMSEAEAKIFADIKDTQITEAVDQKLSAGDFWSRLTEATGGNR